MHERRFNPQHIERLDNPERRKMLPPEQLLELLEIKADAVILDLGAGTGYFTIPAANFPGSQVIALDVEPQMLQHLEQRVTKEGLGNVELKEGPIEAIPLADQTADYIIASLVLHEVEPLANGLREIIRVLKPGGKILCIEWEKVESEQGPPLHHRIHSKDLAAALTGCGFKVAKQTFPSKQHYVTVAGKP